MCVCVYIRKIYYVSCYNKDGVFMGPHYGKHWPMYFYVISKRSG